jgi:hypothetical protein
MYIINVISGVAIKVSNNRAAQAFVKKYGGKIVSKVPGGRKILSATSSGVKKALGKLSTSPKQAAQNRQKVKDFFSNIKDKIVGGGKKKKELSKDDFNAIISGSKKPPSNLSQSTIRRLQDAMKKKLEKAGKNLAKQKKPSTSIQLPKPKPKGTSVGKPRLRKIEDKRPRPMKNVTPRKTEIKAPPSRPPQLTRGNLLRGSNIILQDELKKVVPELDIFPPPPPVQSKESPVTSKKRKLKKKPSKDLPVTSKKRSFKKKPAKPLPVTSKKRRTGPIRKPDTSQLTGKFGVKGFSRTGSTMSDFLIGFTDGKGGKGRNYDKFMAKDSNGQYKVKTEALKSMAKKLKEKMKK